MPELPEVETIRRQLAHVLPGARVVRAGAHPSAKFAEATRITDARLTAVARRGKYLLVTTDDGRELVVHLGMTGRFRVAPAGSGPVDERWQRAWWELDDGRLVEFVDQRRFGRIAVVAVGDHRRLPTLAALGPEPLDPTFTSEVLHERLALQRRRVKTALLSQRVVAGIGNIYADEALWRARINPVTRRVGQERSALLHRALVDVLTEALDHGGTRLRDYRSLRGDTGTHQRHLDCYGRAGEPCVRCGRPLTRRVVDGRGTTFCAGCQRR